MKNIINVEYKRVIQDISVINIEDGIGHCNHADSDVQTVAENTGHDNERELDLTVCNTCGDVSNEIGERSE